MKTKKEWRKVILLANYTELSSTDNLQEADNELLEKIQSILKKDFNLTEQDFGKALKKYQTEVLPQKETILRQKATEIMEDIVTGLNELKDDESFSTHKNPEIYYRMQEIMIMNGGKILKEEEQNSNLTHTMFYTTNLFGGDLGGHTYYFSFDK